jgi:hypothetical protein
MITLYANEYYSKAKPLWEYHIKSDISGKVIFSDELKEGKYGDDKVVIKIDDKIDKLNLQTIKEELKTTKELLEIAKKSYQIDLLAYNKIKDLSTYSKTQKDSKLLKMLNSKKNLLSLKNSLAKLNLNIETLKDKINKKNINISSKYYITKIYPKKGDFVNPSSPLIDIADLSKARLTIFVTDEDLNKLKSSNILIDNKKQKYKIVKILKVADSINLSGYKVEIEIEAPKIFSKLIKVEIK